jgi:2-polyprenyl-3-methyl-5-hydroxy-6-metoxy-1,4-benzoquinol methylase
MESTIATNHPETPDIETSSDDYASRFHGPVGDYFLKVQSEITLALICNWPGASVLDVGGGHGQNVKPLLEHGYPLTIYGSHSSCINRVKRLHGDRGYEFQAGSLLALPFADRSFDVVISYRLISHMVQWRKVIAELSRVARHAILIDFPTWMSLNALTPLLFGLKKKIEKNTRTYISFRPGELKALFRQCGFSRLLTRGEFFLPMVLHRSINRPTLTGRLENVSRSLGLTALLGSPVIMRATRS